ncbi:GIY-YIG nuclease family protein [Asaia krungthepensis]|uniref:Uncharacterized protein n=1 Tax=Asaia krungthepensis NRIC 0535 TaxID=1307925 RepID=A0ABQ0Q339_9PROT|nr:GIY-YIG nuclease family protein [Asaia krungthepensis]GBQ89056.1 hypothetical protein AA0535_1700 [Asaia krungthepensis NRIC 0535]
MTVYLAQGCETKLVKIGFSQQTWERVRTVTCAGTDKLTLLRVMPGGRVAEQWMHREFKHLRCHGEWFSFDSRMMTVEIPHELSQDSDRNEFSPRSLRIDVESEIYSLLAEHYRPLRGAASKLASDANSTSRAAKNWLDRRNLPSAEALLNLMSENPSFECGIKAIVADIRLEHEEQRK